MYTRCLLSVGPPVFSIYIYRPLPEALHQPFFATENRHPKLVVPSQPTQPQHGVPVAVTWYMYRMLRQPLQRTCPCYATVEHERRGCGNGAGRDLRLFKSDDGGCGMLWKYPL